MRCVKGISIVLMLALAPAASAEEGGTDTPEQSLRKSEVHAESKRATTGFADFAAGILRVTTPADDLDEPLPTGTKTDFERRGYIVVSDNRVEILVDRAGQIYKDRIYQGIIPGLRNTLRAGELDELQGEDIVLWAGFQAMEPLQRLFFLLTDPTPRFEVTKKGPTTLEIYFPGFKVPNRNMVRALETQFFRGPVARVTGKREQKGIRYTVQLKRNANYLYRWESPFLFIDFERMND
jgi:hypothetical protein